ncbi:MAG TPA: phosphate ABC transporter substrate-binding protein [Ktedonobacterales bacterium]|nr:phosphate ABC transporter substrate-binding protein [Ktedonobacterales bacterium]
MRILVGGRRAPKPPLPRRGPALVVVALLGLAALLTACAGNPAATSTVSGHGTVAGSTALQPLVAAAAQLFHQQYPQATIDVAGGGSVAGLQKVNSGQADIGDSDIYADPATYPDPNLTDHLVCVIPFAMIVNPNVTVRTLTRDQIIKIFSTREITNWKDVGGPDLNIVPVVRPATSGTRATFRKYILGGRDENGTLLTTDSSQTVLNTVAQQAGAIGYLAMSVVDASVHVVAIDQQMPTPANIEQGRYAFWGFEHMYTLGEPNGAVAAFLDFMLTPAVQLLAKQLGYIPIADLNLAARDGGTPGTAAAGSPPLARRVEEGA